MKLEDLTILYAEDESGIQNTVSDVLDLYVNRVITAQDWQEALELYNLYKPSILLLDICMPKKDGLEVLKEIRKKDIFVPVIIMTAHTEQKYLMNAVELYITKYLIKPFDKNALLDALDECIKVMVNKLDETVQISEEISYNISTQTVTQNSTQTVLNKKESLLLNLLIKNSPNIVSYETIEYHLWDDMEVSKEAFKSLIKDLRKKTSKESIKNVSGIGYKIEIL